MLLVTEPGGVRFSSRNQFTGTVSAVHHGAVNTEVLVQVGAGLQVAAIVTQESARSLDLVAGRPVTVMWKASSVIVGVLG